MRNSSAGVVRGIMMLMIGCLCQTFAQTDPSVTAYPPQHQMLNLQVGGVFPISKEGLKAFWTPGPSGSLSFLVGVSKTFALGLGADFAQLKFDDGAFEGAFPTIKVQNRDIHFGHLYVVGKVSFLPHMRTSPFLIASVGASRMTEASYRVVISGTRITYYHVGGSTRLAVGLGGGADIYLAKWIALEAEARALYMHNDPDAGWMSFLRGGVRFTL